MRFKVFKEKNLAYIILGQIISMFGSNIQQFALSLYVLEVTKSATLFASMLAISVIPRIILSPIAGVIGDWFDRKKSIILLDLIDFILMGTIGIYYFVFGEISIGLIISVVVILEIVEIFYSAAMSAVIPSMVKEEELFEVNSLNQAFAGVTSLLSPLLAMLLFSNFGLEYIFAINSISYLVAIILELQIQIPKSNNKPNKINFKSFKLDFVEGLNVIRELKIFKYIISLGIVLNCVLSPLFNVGLMYIVKVKIGANEAQFGLFGSVFTLSMIVGPIVLSRFCDTNKIGKIIWNNFSIIAILVFMMAILSSNTVMDMIGNSSVTFWLLLVISFLIGMFTTLANIVIGTLFDISVPNEYMGRASSFLNMFLMLMMPLGQMGYGVMLDRVDTFYILTIVGSIIFLSSVIVGKRIVKMKNEERTENKNKIIAG